MDTNSGTEQGKTKRRFPKADSALQQALADSRNEKRQKVLPDPQKKKEVPPTQPYRRNQTELGSDAPVITKFIEKLSKEGASPAQVPILYSPTTGLIHFNLPHGMQPCRSQQSHQSLGTSCIGASQGDASHVQLPVEAEEETRPYRVPANRDSTGHMSTYELRSPTSTLAANVATTPPGSLHSSQQANEEASRKRELRLIKNREAAKECRRRKKEYLECLEWRLNQLEVQNKELMDEVQFLRGILAGKSS